MTVPTGTVAEVLCWVGDDPDRAHEALDAERAGQDRSTLITQLEAITSKEGNEVTETRTEFEDETAENTEVGYDEETGLAPGPEQPQEVLIDPTDSSTSTTGPVPRHPDIEVPEFSDIRPEVDPDDPDAESPIIQAEQVEWIESAGAAHGFALSINGTVFAFSPEMTAALRAAVNQAVVGMAL